MWVGVHVYVSQATLGPAAEVVMYSGIAACLSQRILDACLWLPEYAVPPAGDQTWFERGTASEICPLLFHVSKHGVGGWR